MMARREWKTRDRWEGGWVHVQADGRPLFIIEKQRGGRRFNISTRCHTEGAAFEHLKRFEADPWAYDAEMKRGRTTTQSLMMTADMVLEFREWMLNRDQPASRQHANNMAHRLNEWLEDLGARDLRTLDLAFLKKCLKDRKTMRHHRIIALKTFCTWLRQEEHLLERKDDVTLDLPVPQAVPEKHRRPKAVPIESVRAALGHLAPAYRDCLLLMASTGWHVTELGRFARMPESRVAEGRGDVLAVLQVRHKNGSITRTPVVDPVAKEAADRIRERGSLPRRMNAALYAACDAAEVKRFGFGVMRHSVATWAIEGGADPSRVAEFLDHKDKRTTMRFYADVAVPAPVVQLPKLT